jgi:hypothetical protein
MNAKLGGARLGDNFSLRLRRPEHRLLVVEKLLFSQSLSNVQRSHFDLLWIRMDARAITAGGARYYAFASHETSCTAFCACAVACAVRAEVACRR